MGESRRIEINIFDQTMLLIDQGRVVHCYPVSTAKLGAGEVSGSFQTPRGRHYIRAKIGAEAPLNGVFIGRRSTGENYSEQLSANFPERDWILTRILWLSGLEVGFNRLGCVDTMRRYIYIHGTPDELMTGTAQSIGCIRMYSSDIAALFDWIPGRCLVEIYG